LNVKAGKAVFAAYGWPSDLSDEEILEGLLALNLERSDTGALESRVSAPQSKVVNST
jgi:hypothetical protein